MPRIPLKTNLKLYFLNVENLIKNPYNVIGSKIEMKICKGNRNQVYK